MSHDHLTVFSNWSDQRQTLTGKDVCGIVLQLCRLNTIVVRIISVNKEIIAIVLIEESEHGDHGGLSLTIVDNVQDKPVDLTS